MDDNDLDDFNYLGDLEEFTVEMIGGNVLGLRKFRENVSTIFDKVVNNFSDALVGNNKKGGKTVSILNTEVLCNLLDTFDFSPKVTFDSKTEQYEIFIDEINANGFGETKEEAIKITIDNILALSDDYFKNIDLYYRMNDYKKIYGYFLRIKYCKNNIDKLIEILHLDNKDLFLRK